MRTLKHSPFLICVCVLFTQLSFAQVCSSPATTVYGLDDVGGIYPITVATAAVGARINPAYTGNAPSSSNAMGYDPGSGKFYYFKRNADQAPQEFVSFNPATNTYTYLTSCPSTNNIKTGAVSADGQGYYCIDAAAVLYFYRFSSDKWKLITSTYFDQWGTNVTATLAARSSGDIAFDGWGDLWFLCSSTTQYGLYQFPANLPTSGTASLNIKQKIAPTTPTPNGTSFAGIAISPTGQFYLSQYNDNRFYRLNNNLTLTLMGSFTTSGVGIDLTSCTMPFVILASNNVELNVDAVGGDQMLITWTNENQNVQGFFVESSRDANNWNTLGYVENSSSQLSSTKYSFSYTGTGSGRYYYRIKQIGMQGQVQYSEVKFIDLKTSNLIAISPNPTKGMIQITNADNTYSKIVVLDIAGHIIKYSTLKRGVNSLSIVELPSGTYLLRLESDYGQVYHQKIIKE